MNHSQNRTGLDVYFRDRLAGHLWLDEKRRFVFQYDAVWLGMKDAFPLSVRLPLQSEVYADDLSRPFFSNLLPEAELKRIIARRLQISANNDYDMLRSIGGECAGAVSVIPAGYKPSVNPGYQLLSDEALHQTVIDLPRRPFFAGVEGMRLSLAGAQNKLPVYMAGEDIFIASGNAPSTHILKPPIKDLKETVENEAFCMTLAKKIGLSTPKVSIRRGLDKLYLIERYDRKRDQDGSILRLHQEDFCQALGFLPDQKYESEGGPSLKQCFALLEERSSSPAADRLALLQWTIFNFLVGNADSHAKNLSLMYTNRGPRLAPFYDLICTQVYPDLTDKLAMRIGGENRPSWIHQRHWEKLGDTTGIKSGFVLKALREMATGIVPAARELLKDFNHSYGESAIIKKVVAIIEKRANS